MMGFDVRTAESGVAALKLIQESPANVIISDIIMRDGDGFELLSSVQDRYFLQPLFFFYSGNPKVDGRDPRLDDADGFFTKPFDPEKIEKIILETFRLRREKSKGA